jgi:hypothetical protein
MSVTISAEFAPVSHWAVRGETEPYLVLLKQPRLKTACSPIHGEVLRTVGWA